MSATGKYELALDEQEATDGLWDDEGEAESDEMQAILDRFFASYPDRRLTGSRADWKELRMLAVEMDSAI